MSSECSATSLLSWIFSSSSDRRRRSWLPPRYSVLLLPDVERGFAHAEPPADVRRCCAQLGLAQRVSNLFLGELRALHWCPPLGYGPSKSQASSSFQLSSFLGRRQSTKSELPTSSPASVRRRWRCSIISRCSITSDAAIRRSAKSVRPCSNGGRHEGRGRRHLCGRSERVSRYVRPGTKAVAQLTAEHDPARRGKHPRR